MLELVYKVRNTVANLSATVKELASLTDVDGVLHFLYCFHVSGVKSVSVLLDHSPTPLLKDNDRVLFYNHGTMAGK